MADFPIENSITLINRTQLKDMIENILRGKWYENILLYGISKKIHRQEENGNSHERIINELISKTEGSGKPMILSCISIKQNPVVKINLQCSKSRDRNLKFALHGDDLKEYLHCLPNYYDKFLGKFVRPKTGTKHSKWYPFFMEKKMIRIALGLRMLEIFMFGKRIVNTYEEKDTGILELEVKVVIPDDEDLNDLFHYKYDKRQNPVKINDGKFLFKKNGVSDEHALKMLNFLIKFRRFKNVFGKQLSDKGDTIWGEFIESNTKFALGSWMRHGRIIVKLKDEKRIIVLDPWMTNIDRSTSFDYIRRIIKRFGWTIEFDRRHIRDQTNGEGSCTLAALSRLLSLVDINNPLDCVNDPIPDLYALIASVVSRVC